MAVSGTVSQDLPTLRHIYDKAFRRAGVPAQLITAEYLEIAKDLLNETLSELVTVGVTLWANDHILVGMQEGVPTVTMPVGTVSIERVSLRQATVTTGTVTGTTPTWVLTATEAVEAQFVGLKVSTAGVYNLGVDTSPDGVVWTQVAAFEYEALVTGKWNWLEVVPDTASVAYFRVRETSSPAVSFPVTDLCISIGSNERTLSVIGQDDYVALPNKRNTGTVNSYWTDRQVDGPVLYLWLAPDATHEDYHLVVWRKRHIKDVGEMTDRAEIPQRWVGALSWDLAWRLSAEIPDAKKTPEEIMPFARAAKALIAPSENDGGSMYIQPQISQYTR